MKRYLKKYPPLLGNMPVLPDNVEECPASVLRSAFPNGWKAALPKSKGIAEVFRLGRTWPLRITHVVASAAKNAEPSQDMAMLPSAVIGMAATVAQQTTMALAESSTKEEELPGFKLLRPAHVAPNTASASTPSVPALMDQAPNSNVQPSEPEKSDPQKLIDSLREDLAEEKNKIFQSLRKQRCRRSHRNLNRKPNSNVRLLREPEICVVQRQLCRLVQILWIQIPNGQRSFLGFLPTCCRNFLRAAAVASIESTAPFHAGSAGIYVGF